MNFRIPIDRVVAWLGPVIAAISTGIAAWLIAKVNVLGIPGLNKANTATWIAAGLTALIVAGLHALGGWQWLKGRHIILATPSRLMGQTELLPAQLATVGGHEEDDIEDDLPPELEDREEDTYAVPDEVNRPDGLPTDRKVVLDEAPPQPQLEVGARIAPNPSGLSSKERIRARDLAVSAAMLLLHHAPEVHYTQKQPPRWDGIVHKLKAWRRQYPKALDCSAAVTWYLWNALSHFHIVRDIVNGTKWAWGWTGTLARCGVRVDGRFAIQRADVALYGRGPDYEHTAMIVGRRRRDGKLMVISHGSEGGPYYLPIDYRRDLAQIRRYI